MPTATEQAFWVLLRSELTGETPSSVVPDEALLTLAVRHDLSHLVADALDKAGALGADELSAKFKKSRYMAVYRYEQSRYELEALSGCLAAAEIPFLPLKGAVLREYYPEPWMRTSCDIDVLVHPEDVDRAVKALTEGLGYRYEKTGPHDVSLFTPSGVHIELHYDVMGESLTDGQARAVMQTVWEHSTADGVFRYRMSDPLFYFYHVAHMAKHIVIGGCGVRPFMDLWILSRRSVAPAERQALLKAGGLDRFAAAAERLAEHWFSGGEVDETVRLLEDFVLRGGVYGTSETLALAQQSQRGRVAYWRNAVFPSYRALSDQYLILRKQAWLYPFCLVHRLGSKLFGKGRQIASSRLRHAVAVDNGERKTVEKMLGALGLLKYRI